MRVRAALTFSLVLLAAPAVHPVSARQAQFTSAIRAQITDDLSHEGVSTVRVTLTGASLRDPVVVTSDGQGNFQFPGLSEGRYTLAIDKSGYFPQTFSDIVVLPGAIGNAAVDLGDLNITAQRTVSGTVKWDDGEPVTNAIVHVMSFRGGAYSRAPFVGTVTTNERGEFKIEGLRARRYLVFTYQRPQVVAPGTVVRVALPVFFPGVERPEDAQMLDLRTNLGFTGLALTMKEEKGVSIEGTVTSETLMPGVPVQMGLIIPGVPSPFIVGTESRVGQPFRLYPVPPGSYLLFARGVPAPTAAQAGVTTITPANVNTPTVLVAGTPLDPAVTAIPITVNRGTPIQGFNLNLPAAAVLEGLVEIDDAPQGAPPHIVPATGGVSVWFEWFPKMESTYGILSGQPNGKGEFRIQGAVKGQAYIPGPGSSWANAYVASYKQGTKDLVAGGLPATAGGDPIRILLKRDGGILEGKVTDGSNTPWRAFVAVAPRDRRIEFWFRNAFTMSDGTFKISNIPPGEYDVFAFDRNDEDIYYNADFLRRYAAGGKGITVGAYTIQSLELSLTHTAK
jgi:Carboxypeptidase regulatory-like domain